MASVRRPHVLILGAGLGGLLLAQALRKQNITFDVFDRDESIHSRSQGWCIGIHGFFDDLETAMPDDLPAIDVTSHLRPLDLPAQLCFFRGGQKFLVQSGHERRVIRANRARLRDWLATNVRVNWKTKTTRIEEKGDSVTLHFADGSSATGDVLVGADGVNSMGESTSLPSQYCADRSQSATISSKPKPPSKPFPKALSSQKPPSTNSNSIANSRSRIPLTSRLEMAFSPSSVLNPSLMTPSPPRATGS
jgi:flavin-dependent dehydrogenase